MSNIYPKRSNPKELTDKEWEEWEKLKEEINMPPFGNVIDEKGEIVLEKSPRNLPKKGFTVFHGRERNRKFKSQPLINEDDPFKPGEKISIIAGIKQYDPKKHGHLTNSDDSYPGGYNSQGFLSIDGGYGSGRASGSSSSSSSSSSGSGSSSDSLEHLSDGDKISQKKIKPKRKKKKSVKRKKKYVSKKKVKSVKRIKKSKSKK